MIDAILIQLATKMNTTTPLFKSLDHHKIIMTILIILSLTTFVALMWKRMLVLFKLRHEPTRFRELGERFRRLLKFGFGQKRMVDPEEFKPGLAHIMIFGDRKSVV